MELQTAIAELCKLREFIVKREVKQPDKGARETLGAIQAVLCELARLQSIVDKCHKTTDDAFKVPGPDYVYLVCDGYVGFMASDMFMEAGIYKVRLVSNWSDHIAVMFDDSGDCDYWTGPTYSTPEAAEAAQKEGACDGQPKPINRRNCG